MGGCWVTAVTLTVLTLLKLAVTVPQIITLGRRFYLFVFKAGTIECDLKETRYALEQDNCMLQFVNLLRFLTSNHRDGDIDAQVTRVCEELRSGGVEDEAVTVENGRLYTLVDTARSRLPNKPLAGTT